LLYPSFRPRIECGINSSRKNTFSISSPPRGGLRWGLICSIPRPSPACAPKRFSAQAQPPPKRGREIPVCDQSRQFEPSALSTLLHALECCLLFPPFWILASNSWLLTSTNLAFLCELDQSFKLFTGPARIDTFLCCSDTLLEISGPARSNEGGSRV
jgi:hypothetical protein